MFWLALAHPFQDITLVVLHTLCLMSVMSVSIHQWVSNTIEYEVLEVKKNNIAIESEEVLHYLSVETIRA